MAFCDAGLCVVFGGVTKVELSESVRALDRKSACEVCRNYAKFEFTVVKDVENKESSCRLGLVRHIWCLVYLSLIHI